MEKSEIFLFKIDTFTPSTLPMAKLAVYLGQLSTLYGTPERVHFDKLKKGSAVVQTVVEAPAVPKVSARLNMAGKSDAPEDVARAYRELNQMLRNDNATGVIRKPTGATILAFPGRKTPIVETFRVVEAGELEGIVIRIGGTDASLPIWLEDTEGRRYYCNTRDKQVARLLAAYYLGPPVRVHGTGKWLRNSEEQWEIEEFTIHSFEPLEERSLEQSVAALRAIPGSEWEDLDDPIAYWRRIRSGKSK